MPSSITGQQVPLDAVTDDPQIVAIERLISDKQQQLDLLKSGANKADPASLSFYSTQIDELQRDITTLNDTKAHILDDIAKGKQTDARAALRIAADKAHWDQQHQDSVQKELDTKAYQQQQINNQNTQNGIRKENADTAQTRAQAYVDYINGRKTQYQEQADTAKQREADQATHWSNQDANQQELLRLEAARNKADAEAKAANDAYHAHMADILSRHYDNQDQQKQASDELQSWYDQARIAQQTATQARQDWQAQQDIVLRQQQLTVSSQQNAETRAAAIVQAANAAADRSQQLGIEQQRATEAGAQTGASMLNNRVTAARDTLNNILSLANNKNFGLGGIPDMTGLPGAISDWTTALGGGANTFDTATQLVHAADPRLSGTPQGAGFAATLQQMMDAFQKVSQPLISQNAPNFTNPPQGPALTTPTTTLPPPPPSSPTFVAPGSTPQANRNY